MKYKVNILFSLIISSCLWFSVTAQTNDTFDIKQFIVLPDSLTTLNNMGEFEEWTSALPNPCAAQMRRVYLPNCSELKLIDGLWSYPDSNIYCGACMVKFNNLKTGSYVVFPYIPPCGGKPGYPDLNCMGNLLSIEDTSELKILSFYRDGKRHGARRYFNKSGIEIKSELYEEGKLAKTIFF